MEQTKPKAVGMDRQNYGIQILTMPTADTSGTTVALTFDNNRYLFGHVSEGTQRAMIQRGFGLRKVRNIFLTGSTSWNTTGGLFGTVLTLAEVHSQLLAFSESENKAKPPPVDRDRPVVNIHGGPMLLHTLATARRFIFRTGMPLTVQESTGKAFEWPSDPSYTDENIRVWTIPVRDSNQTLEQDASPNATVQAEQAMRSRVVKDMFDSDWKKDRLIETAFKDAKLPAMVFIRDPGTRDLRGFHCSNHERAPHIKPNQRVLMRNPWPASLVPDLPPASNLPTGVSMSYIVRGHHQRGKFDPKKAIALGVKPGPVFSKLTAGESVHLEDGTIVTPDDVLGPPRVGKGIAFFDLPTLGHLQSLHETLTDSSPDILADVAAAVWILGPGVAADERLQELVKLFNKLQHLVSDPDTAQNKLSFESSALSTVRLAKVDPSKFSVPVYGQKPYGRNSPPEESPSLERSMTPIEAGMKVNIEPTYEVIRDDIPALNLVRQDPLKLPEQIMETTEPKPASAMISADELTEPEIITLGTGSSQPSKYRNVSATLLRLPRNQGNFLFDCGENTLGQLRRTFPADELKNVFRNLQGIWISHLHADHHLGTISVLQARTEALNALSAEGENVDRTIYLMSEKNMIDFVNEYSSVDSSILSSSGLVPLICTQEDGPLLRGKPFDFKNSKTALQKVQTVRVSHCAGAQAVALTFESGLKVSYSGDCRPSSQFCEIGRNSDLLIHEATFDDEKQGDALAKKHSTTAEALGVALKMKAKNVLLTHFSQRYSKIPNLNNVKRPDDIQYGEANADQDDAPIEGDGPPSADALSAEGLPLEAQPSSRPSATPRPNTPVRSATSDLPIAIAFDLMRIKLSEIATAKQYYPAIETMFALQEAASDERREENRKASEVYQKTKAKKTQKLFDEQQKRKAEKQKRKVGSAGGNQGGDQANDGEQLPSTNGSSGAVAEVSVQNQNRNQHQHRSPKNSMKRKAVSPPPQGAEAEDNGEAGAERRGDDGPPLSKRTQKAMARKRAMAERKDWAATPSTATE